MHKITIKEYSEKYKVARENVYGFYKAGNPMVIKEKGKLHILEDKLMARRRFAEKVYKKCTDLYYELLSTRAEHQISILMHEIDNSKSAHNWLDMLRTILFSSVYSERSPLSYKIPKSVWKMYSMRHELRKAI